MLPVAQEMRSERVPPLPAPGSGLSAKVLSHGVEICDSDITPNEGERGNEENGERVKEMSGMS